MQKLSKEEKMKLTDEKIEEIRKFKLTNGRLDFTKAEFIRGRIEGLEDDELSKINLNLLEFQWRTLDVMRDAHPKSLSQEEIVNAIELKYEKCN
jgi:hypothetical protein